MNELKELEEKITDCERTRILLRIVRFSNKEKRMPKDFEEIEEIIEGK